MQLSGIGKIALLEEPCLVLEMELNHPDLVGVLRITRNHLHHATGFGHLENVLCLPQLKRHDVSAHMMDVLLTRLFARHVALQSGVASIAHEQAGRQNENNAGAKSVNAVGGADF